MIEFRSLGPLAVLDHGEVVAIGGPRQRRLLAMLLIHRNTVVSVDRLADAVFAGEPTDAAATTIRSYIARIRRVLGTGEADISVVTQAPGYMLRTPAEATDVGRFEQLLSDGRQHLARDDADLAATSLTEALAAWSGDPYAEFSEEDWARPEAQRLSELRAAAEERLIDAQLACGRNADVIARLDALIDEHPLREGFRAQLMTALYRTGRQADALRAFRRYREQLADEVGLDPSPALLELERLILDHDSTLALVEPAGEALLGYRLGPRLGSGPNGTAYAARLPGVDHEYVVNILRGDRVDTAEFVRTFDATAHELASLRHRALIPLHDWWREPGAAYVVTRRVHMRTLRDRLEQGSLGLNDVTDIVRRVGGALTAAAARGVFHGSVSVDTILFDERGGAFIGDFGIVHDTPPDDVTDFATAVCESLRRLDQLDPAATGAVAFHLAGHPHVTPMAAFVDDLLGALGPTHAPSDTPRPNPFKGLRSFDETDEDDFFGRNELVDGFIRRLADPGYRLTLVVGGSGSGKSSAVRAGLLPRIRRGEVDRSGPWFATSMMPGSAPFKELVESLRRVAVADMTGAEEALRLGRRTLDDLVDASLPATGTLLLIIDQLEELFTLTPDADQGAFLDCLAIAVSNPHSRVRVIATLRADYYDRPLAFQRFGALVDTATVAVPAMSPAELESAIIGPLVAIGAAAEPTLVTELVTALADQPAALPSLQFTLFELAERRPDRNLTLDGYQALGGVDAAIASRAEALYLSMDDDGRAAIRQVFERLVVIGADGEPTSRRSPRTTLSVGPGAVDEVIDDWTHARLLTTDIDARSRVPTVQLAHEAILNTWPRLRGWIDDDRASIVLLGHLRDAAGSWVELDRDDGALYRGARLDQALGVDALGRGDLTNVESEFLAASRARRDSERRQVVEHAEQQARTNRRLRRQLALIGAALVVALIVGLIAVAQRRDADVQRSTANARELSAAADANVVDDPERSILLALAAVDAAQHGGATVPPEAVNALHRAVGGSRIMLDVPGAGGRLAVSPLGDVFVTEGVEDSGIIDLHSLETGDSVRSWRGDDIDINDVAFSRDGSMLAATGDDGSVSVWDPSTGEELVSIDGEVPAWYPSFSADGGRLLIVWPDADVVEIVDTATGETVSKFPTVGDRPVALSPDGTQVAFGFWDAPYAWIVDVETGDMLTELDVPTDDAILNIEWSPDGRQIATGSERGVLTIADAATGDRTAAGVGHTSGIVGLAWSADGSMVATGSNDGTARVWDASSDLLTEIHRFGARDLANGVPGVAFTSDAQRLVVSDWLITATRVYDLRPQAASEVGGFETPTHSASLAFTPDGRGVVASADDAAMAVRDTDTGAITRTIQAGAWSPGFVVSRDGRFAAIAGPDGFPVKIVDLETDEVLGTFVTSGWLNHLAWSPDGAHLSIASGDDGGGTVTIVDRRGRAQTTIAQPGFNVTTTAFDATGTRLAIARNGRSRFDPELDRLQIWDWATGRVVQRLDLVAILVRSDPATNTWITSQFNGSNIDVWDATTGDHLAELAGHTGLIRDITSSDDGSRIATASNDGTARIWDAKTGLQLQVLSQNTDVVAVALDVTGSQLATTDSNGVVRVWALDLDDLTEIAASRVTRSLDDQECRQYLHVDRCTDA